MPETAIRLKPNSNLISNAKPKKKLLLWLKISIRAADGLGREPWGRAWGESLGEYSLETRRVSGGNHRETLTPSLTR